MRQRRRQVKQPEGGDVHPWGEYFEKCRLCEPRGPRWVTICEFTAGEGNHLILICEECLMYAMDGKYFVKR